MKIAQNVKDRYYAKLYISIIAYSMVIVIVLSLIFSSIYSNSLFEQMIADNKVSINKMNIGFENLNKEMDQLYLMLDMNIDVYTYLNELKTDDITRIKASMNANKIYQINPYVNSIVLCNVKANDYVTVGDQDFDPAYTQKKVKLSVTSNNRAIRFVPNEIKISQDSYQGKKHLVSVVYTELKSDKKAIENMVIVNLDWDLVKAGIFEKSNGVTVIYDNNGQVLNYSSDTMATMKMPFEKYFENMEKDEKGIDSISLNVNDKQEVATYIKNSQNDWNIINIRAYEDMMGDLHQKRNMVIFIAIFVLIISAVFGYILSKMLYSPIRKITDLFKDSKYANDINQKGELVLISEVYKEVIKYSENLEKENEHFIPKMKEELLRSLVRNGNFSEDLCDKLRDYQVSIEIRNLFIALIRIDYDDNMDDKTRGIYESTVIIGALKLLEQDFFCEAVNMFSGEICLLINFTNDNVDSQLLSSKLMNVMTMIGNMPGGSGVIGVSDAVNSAKDCQRAYTKAQDMVKYKFVLGYGRVINQDYVDKKLTNSFNYSKEIEKKLISSINMNDREGFLENLDGITSVLKNYTYNDAVIIFTQVSLEGIKAMNKAIAGNKPLKIDFEGFNLMFGNVKTLEQVKKWMIKIFDQYQALLKEIASVKDNKYYEMVEEIKSYIDENYSDVNLSVEMLAERTEYTPNYFAKIFKSITDQYVSDYIKCVRILKAKELLRNSRYSINEISSKVGFINPTYFYSAFRKDVGLTPTSYRNIKDDEKENNTEN